MFIYTVSPILEYSPLFELNYFSKFSFEVGNVIEISIQNKKVKSIIIDKKDLKESKDKTLLRNASFQLKKIEDENIYGNVDIENFQKIQNFANENLVSFGEVLYKFDGIVKSQNLSGDILKDAKILKCSNKDAFEEYLKYLKKDEKSIYIFPDEISLKLFKNFLKKNFDAKKIKSFSIFKVFDFIKNFKNIDIQNSNLFLHNFDFKKYSSYQKPYINNLDLLFLLFEVLNVDLNLFVQNSFFGVSEGVFLEERWPENWLRQFSGPKSKTKKTLVKDKITKKDQNKDYIFSDIFLEKISENIKNKKKSFIFVLSHGYAVRIYCDECNFSVKCTKCKNEFSLIQNDENKILFCKSCKHEEILNPNKNLRCENCGSYKLYDFGIGIQKVYEFLENTFPNKNLKVDESVKKISEIQIQKQINLFSENNFLNIVGSLKLANSILDKVDSVFVLSLGPLVSGKNFYFDEEIIRHLSLFEGLAEEIFIQQNTENEEVWERYKKIDTFYVEEIKNRKLAKLPPFRKIVNFSLDYKNRKILEGLSFKSEIKDLNFKKGRVNFYIIIEKPESILEEIKKTRNIFDIKISNHIENPSFWK